MSARWKGFAAAFVALSLGVGIVQVARDEGGSAAGNASDRAFVADMTPHHQGAIAMARIARERAEHGELRRMADAMIDAQAGEVSVMRSLALDAHHMGATSEGHMGMSEGEMGMSIDMPMLERVRPFDRAFIDMMIPHHRGAIAMAREELAQGEQPALRQMARDIISAQTREIERMRRWREDWYGSA